MISNAKIAAALVGMFALAVPVLAQAPELTADEAAGKVIFEETAGGVGCASCHGMKAQGDIGPAIAGQTVENIQLQMETNENMGFIELTEDELKQVEAYLAVLNR